MWDLRPEPCPQLCKGCQFPGFETGEIPKSNGWGSPAVSLSLAAEEGRTIHQKMSHRSDPHCEREQQLLLLLQALGLCWLLLCWSLE